MGLYSCGNIDLWGHRAVGLCSSGNREIWDYIAVGT